MFANSTRTRWILFSQPFHLPRPRALVPSLLLVASGLGVSPARVSGQQDTTAVNRGLPLRGERKVEFTTDEGTWISLDVSRDGKTILFDLLGHLYTLPVEGGEATRLTEGLGFDSQPRYSPGGSRIVFVSDRGGDENLWLANPDGSHATPLTKERETMFTSPAWTPDGRYVVVSRRKPYYYRTSFELWLYDVQGGSGIRITKSRAEPNSSLEAFNNEAYHNALGVAVSSDRYFYYARKFGAIAYNMVLPLWDIARLDRRIGEEAVVVRAPGSAFRPVLSPDGTKLIYGTRSDGATGLRVRDLQSGGSRWLKYPIQRDDQESSSSSRDLLPGFAFLPDGSALIASYGGKLHRIDIATGDDRVIPFRAKVSRELGPRLDFPIRVDSGPVRARLLQSPASSPDGKRLAFTAFGRLYGTDLPAGKPKRITQGDGWEFHPAWSPDGKWLVYVTWTEQGGHLWKIASDGRGGPRRLTQAPAFYAEPVWSPDGSRIFVLRMPWSDRQELLEEFTEFGPSPNQDLIWLAAGGGDAHLVAPAPGWQLHFSSDSDRIYFTVQGTTSELASVRFDGSDRRVRLRVTGRRVWDEEPTRNTHIVLSPDGRLALILFRYQVYLASVPPPLGTETPTIDLSSPSVAVRKLTDVGADYVGWAGTDRGLTAVWSLGSTVYRLPIGTAGFEVGGAPPAPEAVPVIVERQRSRPRGSTVLRGGRVISMRGAEVLTAADIVVTGDRIVAVGNQGTVPIPPGATIVDLSGTTIVPGFVDTHTHWTYIRRDVLDRRSWDFLATLAYGVTTGRDPQTQTNDIFAYQDLEEAGEIVAPRLFSTGPAIFYTADFQSAKDAVDAVSKYRDFYRTHTVKAYLVGNRAQRQWLVEAAAQLRVMPTTEGMSDTKLGLTQFIDGFSGQEHNFPIVPLYRDIVELVVQSGAFYNPVPLETYGGPTGWNYFVQNTEYLNDPKVRRFYPHDWLEISTRRTRAWFRTDEYSFRKVAESTAKIVHAGGKVSVGSHGNFPGVGFHWTLWTLADGGLTPLEALRLATLRGAEAIGYGQDLGSIEVGKLADFVVLNKNPLEDIRNTLSIRYVMKGGRLWDGGTMNEIGPDAKR